MIIEGYDPERSPPLGGAAGHVAYSGQLPPVPGLAYDAPSPPAFAKSQPNMYGLAAYTAPLSSCLPQQKRYAAPEFEPHPMASNGGGFASANLQGSPVYVGGNFVDSMAPASGPVFNLGHLSHPSLWALQPGGLDWNPNSSAPRLSDCGQFL